MRLDFSAENSAILAALNHVNIAQSYSSLIQVVYDMMVEKQALVVSYLVDECYKLTFTTFLWIITSTKVIPALKYAYYI